jgi:DNA-binding CsgD family transcriptional regulator
VRNLPLRDAYIRRLESALRGVHDPLAKLTPREREVLALIAKGKTDPGIGDELAVTRKTVEAHVRSFLGKLDLPKGTATRTGASTLCSPLCGPAAKYECQTRPLRKEVMASNRPARRTA